MDTELKETAYTDKQSGEPIFIIEWQFAGKSHGYMFEGQRTPANEENLRRLARQTICKMTEKGMKA